MTTDELISVLHQIGVQDITMGSNGWVRACCPYHSETRPSWGILATEGHHPFSCFACKASGNLFRLVVDLTQCSDSAARQLTGSVFELSSKKLVLKRERAAPLPLEESELFPFALPLAPSIYLQRRGFDLRMLRRLGIRYHPELNRVMFPWYLRLPKTKSFRTELYGVTGRSLNDADPAKTMPLYGTRKGLCLYVPAGKILEHVPLILVEGELDALALFQAGFHNVAALGFGRITEDQIRIIQWYAREVITFFDDDEAGEHLHKLVLERLKGTLPVGRVRYEGIVNEHTRKARKIDPAEFLRFDKIFLLKKAIEMAEKRSDFPRLAL